MEFTTEQIEEIVHDYIERHLTIEVTKGGHYTTPVISVVFKLKDETISVDTVYL